MNSKKSIGGLMNYLYGASLQGIQSFIFETNKLKEIIGASEMIEQLCSSQFMKKYDIPDHNFIIKAAGNIKCIIRDKAKIQNIVKTWPKFVSNRAPGLFFSQAMIEYDGELKKEYLDELERKLIVTKNKSSLTTSLSPMAAIRSRRTGKPAVDWLDSIKKNKQTPRDATSKAKQIAGAIDAPQRLMDKCFDIPEQKKTSLYPFDVTDMLLENESTGWLAVIHADGNSLGNKIQQMIRQLNKQHKDVKGHFKIFSEQLDKSTINATKYAIKQVVMPVYNKSINKEKYPFRPVVIGGDDLTIIIRADLALDFTKHYLEAFSNETKDNLTTLELSMFDNGLTACAGIAYMKDSYPFYYAVNLAEELCNDAKKASKFIDSENVPSSVSFHKIQDSFIEDYEEIIHRELQPNRHVSFKYGPYGLDEDKLPSIDNLIKQSKLVQKPGSPKSGIRKWFSYLYEDMNKADLWLQRVMDISKEKKGFESLNINKAIQNNRTHLYDVLSISSISVSDYQEEVKDV
jgi:hypothetical protein